MNSHELAKLLLTYPDLPVATHAHNHTYLSATDRWSHGDLKIGVLGGACEKHIVIGDISKMNINKPNWYVEEMLHGHAPAEWHGHQEGITV